jgi:hypothetical protein
MLLEIIWMVASGMVGGLIGAYISNRVTHTDRNGRVADFRRAISGLRTKFIRQRPDALYQLYAQSVPVVAGEVAVIRRYIGKDRLTQFIADADRYCLLTHDEIQAHDPNHKPTAHAPVSFDLGRSLILETLQKLEDSVCDTLREEEGTSHSAHQSARL